jgi:hypothetical protein
VFLESGHKLVQGIGRALSVASKQLNIMIIWNQNGSEKKMRKQLKRGRKKNKGNIKTLRKEEKKKERNK